MSALVQPKPPTTRVFTREATEARTRSQAWVAAGLVAIAIGLAAVATLGPLVAEVINYRVTETLRNQTIGLDAVSLFVVAPLALAAAVLVRRGHVAGFALALAIGAYTTYMFLQYILGPDYANLPGNNERLFLLCLFLFTAGWLAVLGGWAAIDPALIPTSRRRDRMVGSIVLPVLGFVVFVRYVPLLADWMSSAPEDAGYRAGPSFAWAIAMLDLGVLLPVIIAACVGLIGGTHWAQKALYLAAGWLGLIGPAVAAMGIVMYVNDDPSASGGSTAFMTALGLAFAALAVFLYLPLVRHDSKGDSR